METFFWKTANTRFYGQRWVPQQPERVMVIVHGIGEHIGRYAAVAESFMEQGYAVTGIDHYGHGKSDGTRGTTKGIPFVFDYLESFIEQVKEDFGNKPVVIYGHSMGGGIVTGFLLHRQPALLAAVISAPALLLAKQPPAVLRGILKVISKIAPRLRIAQGLDINKISHDPLAVETFKNDPLRHDRISLRLANDMITNGRWCLQHADLLRIPALLIHGNADAFTGVKGSRLFAERAPEQLLTYKEWDQAYHELHNEPFGREVLLFIAGWLSAIK